MWLLLFIFFWQEYMVTHQLLPKVGIMVLLDKQNVHSVIVSIALLLTWFVGVILILVFLCSLSLSHSKNRLELVWWCFSSSGDIMGLSSMLIKSLYLQVNTYIQHLYCIILFVFELCCENKVMLTVNWSMISGVPPNLGGILYSSLQVSLSVSLSLCL